MVTYYPKKKQGQSQFFSFGLRLSIVATCLHIQFSLRSSGIACEMYIGLHKINGIRIIGKFNIGQKYFLKIPDRYKYIGYQGNFTDVHVQLSYDSKDSHYSKEASSSHSSLQDNIIHLCYPSQGPHFKKGVPRLSIFEKLFRGQLRNKVTTSGRGAPLILKSQPLIILSYRMSCEPSQ